MSIQIPGIDVSHWQGNIIWDDVAKSYKKFVIMKATEGLSYVDDTFVYNYTNAKRVGMMTGAYHYFRPGQSALIQAEHFLSTTSKYIFDIAPVLDLETTDNTSKDWIIRQTKEWMDKVKSVTGRTPILYSSPSFLNTYFTINGKPPEWAKDVPLWIANWTTNNEPYMPKGWDTWTIWQYSNQGKVFGINGYVDLDYYRLDVEPEEPVGESVMTQEELLILKKLDAAKEAFLALPILREQDQTQFSEYIDAAKNIVLARPTVKELNK